MEHICDNCIYKTEPESIRDYYLKTFKMPDLMHWNEDGFKHRYWLCSNANVSKIDSTNNSTIYRPCQSYNSHGNCTYFKSADAEDIKPSTVNISADKTEVKVNEDFTLSIAVTPYTTPAVTEEKEVSTPQTDEEGNPVLDEEGNQKVTVTTETVTVTPEVINDQEISYTYTWYKNNRKLFQRKTAEITITPKEEAVDEYYCVVTQSIVNNGDGGTKTVEVKSDTITVTVEAEETTSDGE